MIFPLSEWSTATLNDVASWGSGGTPQAGNPDFYGGDIPWAVIGDLTDGVVVSTRSTLTQAGLDRSSAKLVPEGAVLIAMYGSIGKLGIAGKPMSTNQAIAFAVPKPGLDRKYLFYYLLAQRHALDAAGKGAAQRNISQSIIKSWPIHFPNDYQEQLRIVGILENHLSRLDAGDAALNASERRLASLRRSALEELFGSAPLKVPLTDLVDEISSGKSFGSSNGAAGPDEWGIIRVSAMTWGEFRPEKNKAVASDAVDPRNEIRPGDLLVSRANTSEYVGASVLVGDVRTRLLLSDKSLRLKPAKGINSKWLWRALQAPSARRQISSLATGTKDSMRNISQSSLRRIELPQVTPAQQAAAVERFATIDNSVTRLTAELTVARRRGGALRRSLLNAAFSGRLTGEQGDFMSRVGPSVDQPRVKEPQCEGHAASPSHARGDDRRTTPQELAPQMVAMEERRCSST